jgi:hypothetical protein
LELTVCYNRADFSLPIQQHAVPERQGRIFDNVGLVEYGTAPSRGFGLVNRADSELPVNGVHAARGRATGGGDDVPDLGRGISGVEAEFVDGIARDGEEEEGQRDQEGNEELHVVVEWES